jgi:hypothetical protein
MDRLNHQDYYIARAAAARDLAQRAVSPAIAAIHTKLAAQYDLAADQSDKDDDMIVTVI